MLRILTLLAVVAGWLVSADQKPLVINQTTGKTEQLQAGNYITLPNSGGTLIRFVVGDGSPEGSITAGVGSMYYRTNGGTGTTLYVKESGTGNTGWAAVSSGAGTIGGSIASGQVAYGSGANTIQGSATLTYGATTGLAIAPTAVSSGAQEALLITGAANTAQTASTDVNDLDINLARTVQFATGAKTDQRAVYIKAPTYSAVGATTTTTAATLAVNNAPVAGTNMTLTNRYAINVESGAYGGPAGTAALPTYTVGQANTGMYSTAGGFIGFSSSGTLRLTIDATAFTGTLPWRGQNGTAAAPALSFSGDTNCGFYNVSADNIGIACNGVVLSQFLTTSTQSLGNFNLAPATVSSGAACVMRIVAAADTAQTASTESSSVIVDLSATRQFATGALTTQRAFRIAAPTYSAVGASTITNAATFAISGAPTAGTNATLTNSYALWVQAGASQFDGGVNVRGSVTATGGSGFGHFNIAPTATAGVGVPMFKLTVPANTTLTASTEIPSFYINLSSSQQWSTGALTTQRFVAIEQPTIAFVGASTVTTAATFAVADAPAAGTNATITNSYALWVQAGRAQFGGAVLSSNATAGVGYSTGAGGTVTQVTSITTGVTLNKICGQITTVNATINTGTVATFTVTNSTIAAGDNVIATLVSGNNSILCGVSSIGAGNFNIILSNNSGSNITATFVINFAIIKAVTN